MDGGRACSTSESTLEVVNDQRIPMAGFHRLLRGRRIPNDYELADRLRMAHAKKAQLVDSGDRRTIDSSRSCRKSGFANTAVLVDGLVGRLGMHTGSVPFVSLRR